MQDPTISEVLKIMITDDPFILLLNFFFQPYWKDCLTSNRAKRAADVRSVALFTLRKEFNGRTTKNLHHWVALNKWLQNLHLIHTTI